MADERTRALERRAAEGDPAARAALAGARRREGGRAEHPSWQALWRAGADLYHPAQLGAGLSGLVTADLEPLGRELARRARAFLEDGREPEVLDALAAEAEVYAMEFNPPRVPRAEVRPRPLVSALREPAALVRLGLLYEAAGAVRGVEDREALAAGGVPRWLLALLSQAEARPLPAHSPLSWTVSSRCALSWDTLRGVLEAGRVAPVQTVRTLLGLRDPVRTGLEQLRAVLAGCPGLGVALSTDFAEVVREGLTGRPAFGVCRVLVLQRAPLGPFVEALVEAATEERVGGQSWQLVSRARDQGEGPAVRRALVERLEHPRSEVRWRTVRGLDRYAHPDTVEALQRVAARDRSSRVRRAAAAALSAQGAPSEAPVASRAAPELPPLPAVETSAVERLRRALEGVVPEATARTALDALTATAPWPGDGAGGAQGPAVQDLLPGLLAGAFGEFDRDPHAHLPALLPVARGLDLPRRVRLLNLTGHVAPGWQRDDGYRGWIGHAVLDLLARDLGPEALQLDALERACAYAGIAPEFPGTAALDPQAAGSPFSVAEGWAPGGYYLRHPAVVDRALRGGLAATRGIHLWSARLLRELEAVLLAQPRLVPSWIEGLVELGTDAPKAKRAFAQRVLDAREDLDLAALLVPRLRARKGARRANAAAWLARRGVVEARAEVEAARDREEHPKVRRALERALGGLG